MVKKNDLQDYDFETANNVLHMPEPTESGERKDDIRQVVEAIFSTDKMNVKSNLTARQLKAIVRAYVHAEHYNDDVMRGLIQYVLETKPSEKGLARRQLVKALQSAMSRPDESMASESEDEAVSLRRRLL